jgi:hypothetical protein
MNEVIVYAVIGFLGVLALCGIVLTAIFVAVAAKASISEFKHKKAIFADIKSEYNKELAMNIRNNLKLIADKKKELNDLKATKKVGKLENEKAKLIAEPKKVLPAEEKSKTKTKTIKTERDKFKKAKSGFVVATVTWMVEYAIKNIKTDEIIDRAVATFKDNSVEFSDKTLQEWAKMQVGYKKHKHYIEIIKATRTGD